MKKVTLLFFALALLVASAYWWGRDQRQNSPQKIQKEATKNPRKKQTPTSKKKKGTPPPQSKPTPQEENVQKYSNEEIERLKRKKFKSLTEKTQKSLITVDKLREKSEEQVHHMPKEIHEAGKKISLIERIRHKRTDFNEEAKSFYQNCANRPKVATPVRSLCLTNLIKINQSQGQKTDFTPYPKNITQMAQQALEL